MDASSRMHVFRSYETSKLMRFCPVQCRKALNDKIAPLRAKNKKQATPSSLAFSALITGMQIKHTTEVPLPAGGRMYFLDVLIGEPFWVAVEIDGGVHKKQQSYDSRRDNDIMLATGWVLLRFTNEDVRSSAKSMWTLLLGTLMEIAIAEEEIGSELPEHFSDRMQNFMYKYTPELYERYYLNPLKRSLEQGGSVQVGEQ